ETRVFFTARSGNVVLGLDANGSTGLTYLLAGVGPFGLALAPNGELLVANSGSGVSDILDPIDPRANSVSVLDPLLGSSLATIPLCARPSGIATDASGGTVAVLCAASDMLATVDIGTHMIHSVFPLPAGSHPRAVGHFVTPTCLLPACQPNTTSSTTST